MYCPKCGKEVENGASFCGACGAKIETQPEYGSDYQQQAAPAYTNADPAYANAAPMINRSAVSKKEFIKKYGSEKLRKNINSMSIVCYILAAISVGFGVTSTGDFWSLIDVAILVGLTLGMHLGKSKACAILLLIVSIIECILTSIMLGRPAGWWWIIASASALSSFVKLDKEYNLFLLEGSQIPNSASQQSLVPNAPVQPPVQSDVYYTPPQPVEAEIMPGHPVVNGEIKTEL